MSLSVKNFSDKRDLLHFWIREQIKMCLNYDFTKAFAYNFFSSAWVCSVIRFCPVNWSPAIRGLTVFFLDGSCYFQRTFLLFEYCWKQIRNNYIYNVIALLVITMLHVDMYFRDNYLEWFYRDRV